MGEYADPIDPREGLVEFPAFLGLRNNVGVDGFSLGDLDAALNVDVDDSLSVGRRKGFSAPVVAGVDRSLWASGSVCLGVGSNSLKQVHPNWTTTTLRTGLTAERPLSYAAVGDRVCYSNGVVTGCVQNGTHRTWGLDVPAMPVLSAVSGAMRAGKYQVVVAYLRQDGQESGAGRAATIELTDTGGISVSPISVSTDPTVTHKIVYATSVDGETLYRSGVITNATTSFTIDEVRKDASPLTTQFLCAPPAGDHVAYWRGWMLVAKDARLYPSESYAPELFDLRRSVPFLNRLTMLAPVRDGVWVGTDSQVIWLDGESPEKWNYTTAADYGAIPGALAYGDSELLGDGSAAGEPAAFFATKQGLCVGRAGGQLSNLTQSRFAYPAQDRGAVVVRRHRGIAQMLATLQGTEVAGNVYV